MINWLKFFPLKWSCDNNPTEVHGPYLTSLKNNKWIFGDCTLHFGAPRANPIFGFSGQGTTVGALSPGRTNILQTQWERVYFSGIDRPSVEWDFDLFYVSNWYFVGPWFTGHQAELSANALLITADKTYSFADQNLFHPRIFESAVSNHLDRSYGHSRAGRKAHYCGPLNWRVLPISSSIQAVICDVHTIGNSSKENPLLHRLVFFPISPQQFIQIDFDFGGVEIYRDEIRAKPLFKLCDSIIDTLRLDVGQATLENWNKVKESCPDMSITASMGEFPWPLQKVEKTPKKTETDITPSQKTLELPSDNNRQN